MTQQTENNNEIKEEQLEKALNEMDDINPSDKSIFRVDSDTFRFNNVEYKLIEDHKEGFDIEMMEERFTDYLLKYDYIVGDIAYEKLRLRGFFEDNRKGVPIDMKISNLEDYLIEYCNFGCQYFVFERVEKPEKDPESYFKRNNKSKNNRKTNQRNRRNNTRNRRNKQNQTNNRGNQTNKKQNSKNESSKDFQVVKKQETKTKQKPSKTQEQQTKSKKTQTKKQFEIRKKKD